MIGDKLSGPFEASQQIAGSTSAGSVASLLNRERGHTSGGAMDSRGESCRRPKRLGRRRELDAQKRPKLKQCNSINKSSFRCKNILATRSLPLLFTLVCFLIIANTRCDQAGGTNAGEAWASEQGSGSSSGGSSSSSSSSNSASIDTKIDKLKTSDLANISTKDLEALEQQAVALKNQQHHKSTVRKMDPLNILREIYLDSNSKVITMLMPDSETVQKFHPNGRYGRRSVDNINEPHVELGKLVYNEDQSESQQAPLTSGESSALRAILRGIGRGGSSFDSRLSAVATAHARGAPTKYQTSSSLPPTASLSGAQGANYQLEMNKLLKCNFTGVSNLYWCDAATSNQS